MGFIHLNLHSQYSLSDGMIEYDGLADAICTLGSPAVALTDQYNLFGAVKFYRKMTHRGIKPIIGVDCHVGLDEKFNIGVRLLCQNILGYRNLVQLITRSYQSSRVDGLPILRLQWLADMNEGLLVLLDGEKENFAMPQPMRKSLSAKDLEYWLRHFQGCCYLEISRIGQSRQEETVEKVISLAAEFDTPVVATNKVRFLKQDDYQAHEVRVCINEGHILKEPLRESRHTAQQYLRSEEEMCALFEDIPEAIDNTFEIAKRCNFEFVLGETLLPDFGDADNQDECLTDNAQSGLRQRLSETKPYVAGAIDPDVYQKRLQHELGVIKKMGFSGYFLIVADFIAWAKQNSIPVGPGRGSGAGSLVAYSLGITGLDPIHYDLLFERFLNPERVSLPDFDIDFCMERRDEVIDYVAKKYGYDRVCQIITYGRMSARAVIRDVGRVLGYPYGFVDGIAKLIPNDINITLHKAMKKEKAIGIAYREQADVKTMIDLATQLEGMARNVGRHAGGLVIAPQPLVEYMPLYYEEGSETTLTQFDMGDVQNIGLVKFDFLGLKTLTIIHWAMNDINESRAEAGKPPIFQGEIPQDDKKTFALISEIQTIAVFQLESDGIKRIIKELRPDCFEDIIALIALFRPGPLGSGMVDDFIATKHGYREAFYLHESLQPILETTYGVILYQEQVMKIAQVLAGHSLGEADLLRRAMGKKEMSAMVKQRSIFINGATKNNIDRNVSSRIFDLMEKFADYGFNKSHSAAYALLTYRTAWLKANYPAMFMAAALSADMENTDKVVLLLKEMKNIGLELLSPCISQSQRRFTVSGERSIRYGLGALRGLGTTATDLMIKEREADSIFSDLFDLCRRVLSQKVHRRAFEVLIYSGALDIFELNRGVLDANLNKAIAFAEQCVQNMNHGQDDLFGLGGAVEEGVSQAQDIHSISYNLSARKWDKYETLAKEKEALGFYLSGHPIQQYEEELQKIVSINLNKLDNVAADDITIAGYIVEVQKYWNKSGKTAEVSLEDQDFRVKFRLDMAKYDNYQHYLKKNTLIIVRGSRKRISNKNKEYASDRYIFSAKELFTLEQYRNTNGILKLTLDLDKENIDEEILTLKDMITPFKTGNSPILIKCIRNGIEGRVSVGRAWRVNVNDKLLEQLYALLGRQNVILDYRLT